MKIIVCVDDNLGMLFHKRRQSKDCKVLEDIATFTEHLWISPFSEKMFSEAPIKPCFQVSVGMDFLQEAGQGEYCFVEDQQLAPYENKIEQMILYRWNRKYPSDVKLEFDLSKWILTDTKEFAGNSHEKITREIYEKRM